MLPLVLAAGCGSSSGSGDPGRAAFYEALRADARAFGFDAGAWTEDYGDAAAYGLAYHVRVAADVDEDPAVRAEAGAIADAARGYDRYVVEKAGTNPFWYVEHLEEVFMAAQGLIEHAGVTGDRGAVPAVDRLLDLTTGIVGLLGDYAEISVGEFAADTYGSTAITGAVALLELQHATYLGGRGAPARVARAAEIVAAIDAAAWDEALGAYRFAPDVEKLHLYPNSIMMLVLNRLFERTGERRYLERAGRLFEGIQPLRHPEGFYRSPYSAEVEGATTDEYSTLSSQNYLMLALTLLHENTGLDGNTDGRYLAEVLTIVDHVRRRLYDPAQGRILHHWIDGHVARPTDPDYFCSGCNLQTLYVLWYLQHVAGVTLD